MSSYVELHASGGSGFFTVPGGTVPGLSLSRARRTLPSSGSPDALDVNDFREAFNALIPKRIETGTRFISAGFYAADGEAHHSGQPLRRRRSAVPSTPNGGGTDIVFNDTTLPAPLTPSAFVLGSHPLRHCFVLLPATCALSILLSRARTDYSIPQLRTSVTCRALNFSVSGSQAAALAALADGVRGAALRARFAYMRPAARPIVVSSRSQAPRGDDALRSRISRSWWHFAFAATLILRREGAHGVELVWADIDERRVLRRIYASLHERRMAASDSRIATRLLPAPRWSESRVRRLQLLQEGGSSLARADDFNSAGLPETPARRIGRVGSVGGNMRERAPFSRRLTHLRVCDIELLRSLVGEGLVESPWLSWAHDWVLAQRAADATDADTYQEEMACNSATSLLATLPPLAPPIARLNSFEDALLSFLEERLSARDLICFRATV